MATDGSIKIGTEVSTDGLKAGLGKIGDMAKSGFGAIGSAAAGMAKITMSAMTATGTAVLGLGAYAIKVGGDFEAGMSKVSAISGATGDDLEQLEAKAKQMGATTKFSATEASEAMQYMAMAGWQTEDMLNGIDGIMNLAAADGLDLATTSDIVTDALTAFGLKADDAGHFADVLAKASSSANTNVSMMGETFKYVAPVAGALGYSVEDCSVAIGLMANSGIKASQAGTSLRTFMSRLAKPTDEVETAMKKLGISLTNSDGSMRSLDDVMKDMRKGFAGLTEEQKATYASMLGGQEAMSGLLAIANASEEDFNALTDSIANADGAAADMAETMQNNLQGQLTIMKSSAEGLGIALYQGLQEPLTDLARLGAEALAELTMAFEEGGTEGLIEAGAGLITNLVLGAAEKIPELIEMAGSLIENIVAALMENLPQLVDAGVNILASLAEGILTSAGTMWTAAFEIIAALLSGITERLPDLVVCAQEVILAIVTSIAENLPSILQSGMDILLTLITGVTDLMPELAPLALQIIQDIATSLIENFPLIAQAGIDLLVKLMNGISESIPQLVPVVMDIITMLVDTIRTNLPEIVSSGVNILTSLISGIASMLPELIPMALDIILDLIFALIDNLPQLLECGADLAMGIFNGIWNSIPKLLEIIPDLIAAIWDTITEIDWWSLGQNVLLGIVNGLTSIGSVIWDAIKSVAGSIWDGFLGFFGIHSPSKLMEDTVGKNIMLGVGVGIEDEEENVAKDAEDAAQVVAKKMQQVDVGSVVTQMQTQPEIITERAIVASEEAFVNRQALTGLSSNNGNGIDYERLADANARAMSGIRVDMDGQPVGQVISPYVDRELGDTQELEERGVAYG